MVQFGADDRVDVHQLVDVLYSKKNAFLDASFFPHSDRGAVTAKTHGTPLYLVMVDLELKKRATSGAPGAPGPPRRARGVRRLPSVPVLRVRVGSASGVSFRVKGCFVEGLAEGSVRTGEVRVWGWVAVLSSENAKDGRDPSARLWVTEPAPDLAEDAEIHFRQFYVRGRFRVVTKDNNERRSREAFLAFGKS